MKTEGTIKFIERVTWHLQQNLRNCLYFLSF